MLAVTTHRRRGQPRSRARNKRNSAIITSTAPSLAALLVRITIFRLVRLLSRLRREPPQRTPFPDVGDQLNQSTPTDQHLHAVGGQTLCAGWAMNRPVCATCRSRRRPDKDVLALRADQKDARHATVGIILSSAQVDLCRIRYKSASRATPRHCRGGPDHRPSATARSQAASPSTRKTETWPWAR